MWHSINIFLHSALPYDVMKLWYSFLYLLDPFRNPKPLEKSHSKHWTSVKQKSRPDFLWTDSLDIENLKQNSGIKAD